MHVCVSQYTTFRGDVCMWGKFTSRARNKIGLELKARRTKEWRADVQMCRCEWKWNESVARKHPNGLFSIKRRSRNPQHDKVRQRRTRRHRVCGWVCAVSKKWENEKRHMKGKKKTHVQSEASFVLKEVLFWRFMPICEHPWAINKLEKKRRNEKRTSDKARSRACVCNNCRSRKKPVRKKITPLTAKLVETYRRKDEYLHTKECKGLKGNFTQLLGFHQSQNVSGADR